MALIAVACYDTVENKRSSYTRQCLESFRDTVDWNKHRLIISDNGSIEETHKHYEELQKQFPFEVIYNNKNLGTARAINKAWEKRLPDEHAVKADNDVLFTETNWLDRLVDCVEREPKIGICGLKRTDCIEHPDREDWYKSKLIMLPPNPGHRWIVVEHVNHVMGTVQLFNTKFLDKIGYLYQAHLLWGLEDALVASRCVAAGFVSVFYPHILIHHIDPGGTTFHIRKELECGKFFPEYHKLIKEYKEGTRSVYYGPNDD